MPLSIKLGSTLTIRTGWLVKLANSPQASWQRFKQGLGIFVFSALLLLFINIIWLNLVSVALLAIGFLWAGYGYIGILAYRLTNAFNQVKPPADLDK